MRLEYEVMDAFGQLTHLNDRKINRIQQENNPTSLTDMQIIVLDYIIVESRDRDVFSKDIETFFDIKASSASSLVGYLEKAGYIRREALPQDHRMLRLIVTEKGREVEDWILKVIDRGIMSGLAGFTEEEMLQLLQLMRKMAANMKSVVENGYPHSESLPSEGE